MSFALGLLWSLTLLGTPVVRCTNAQGEISYQDPPCAPGEHSDAIELPEVPLVPPPAVDAADTADMPEAREPHAGPPPRAPEEPRAWRCIADNGEVFYRHDGCPVSIGVIVSGYGRFARSDQVWVEAIPISRSEACEAIAAGGRLGADRDQRAQAYDKLTGRDLCR